MGGCHKQVNDEKRIVLMYGADILSDAKVQSQKRYLQHGTVSVFEHSLFAACLCLRIAAVLHIRVDQRAMVRGALLHDYFLYDWHDPDPTHRLHGFRHAMRALKNARRDFSLGRIECDMIRTHMFPLNLVLPRYRESAILCVADKICALAETLFSEQFRRAMAASIH